MKEDFRAISLTQLQNLKAEYEDQIQILQEVEKAGFLTPLLNALPTLTPKGVWLTSISFGFEPVASFKLEGRAYLEETEEQINFVNKFFNNLKDNDGFKNTFSQISLDFIRQRISGEFEVTEFGITGRK